jgi:hypothetical protein
MHSLAHGVAIFRIALERAGLFPWHHVREGAHGMFGAALSWATARVPSARHVLCTHGF